MNAHPHEERVHDYVDGLLAATYRETVEAHLASCATCRAEVESIRRLIAAAAALPRSVEPPASLWRAVAARTVERGEVAVGATGPSQGVRPAEVAPRRARGRVLWLGARTLRSVRWELAAAAAVLVALSSVVTAVVVRDGTGGPAGGDAPSLAVGGPNVGATEVPAAGNPTAPVAGNATGPAAVTAASLVESAYEPTVARLRAELAARRSELSPATIAVVDSNLQVIDRAIAATRAALAADPSSRPAASLLATMYRKKIGVLEQTLRLGT